MAEFYGKLRSEQRAEENMKCRSIVRDIMETGLTQRQIWFVLYNLALGLENHDDAQDMASFIKERKGSELFLSNCEE